MAVAKRRRVYDARPDSMDFRDKMYETTLVEVPRRLAIEAYLELKVPVLDQGKEGACTGFGLATVANYLLRQRHEEKGGASVSPRMFYEMAKRYDEWPGERYSGSSARGAMKGWYKHGVCAESLWRYDPGQSDARLTQQRIADAASRPLGAYLRVTHRDLVAMHAALTEVGILYATASVHAGWENVGPNGMIPLREEIIGGHAFAIVGFDDRGFWIQNSWGPGWGRAGCGLIGYRDWLTHATDVWVARLGVPMALEARAAGGRTVLGPAGGKPYLYADLRPHIVSIGNDGKLASGGSLGTGAADVAEILRQDFSRITRNWKKKRLLLYAHGGLVSEKQAALRVSDYRAALLAAEVYPLAFVWKTDVWTTLGNILRDALSRRRPEGMLDLAKDFLLDRVDDALEPLARGLGGKAMWDEMKENGLAASASASGGARMVLGLVDELMAADERVEVHVVAHSAGAIFHAPLVRLLTANGRIGSGPLRGKTGLARRIESCTLWAPACSVDLFKQTYLPAIRAGRIGRFAVFTLTDRFEQDDDCAGIYHKSLLYLVSDALETIARIPLLRNDGEPLLGMEKFIRADTELGSLFAGNRADWIRSPNTEPETSANHSTARRHGDFDDDRPTVLATLARILGRNRVRADFSFPNSPAALRQRRQELASER